jgi:hypothetical protein
LFINDSGQTSVGSTSTLLVNSDFSVIGTGPVQFSRFSDPAVLRVGRAQGNALAPTAVTSSEEIGRVQFDAYDGSNYHRVGQLSGRSDGAISDTSSPGFLVLSTTPSGSTAPSERMRLDSSGRLGLGTSSPATLLHLSSATGSASPTPTELRIATTTNASDWSTTDPWGRISYYSADTTDTGPKIVAAIDAVATAANGGRGRLDFKLSAVTTGTLTSRLVITEAGNVGIGTTSPGSALEINAAAATSPFIAKINNAESARIDSSGRLLVGTSTSAEYGIEGKVQIAGTADAHVSLVRHSNNSFFPSFNFVKSRGIIGSPTIVNDNDTLGKISFAGYDGTDYTSLAASILSEVDGTPGANDMPGRLVFSTTASGASSPTERMRITNDGNVFVGKTITNRGVDGFVALANGQIRASTTSDSNFINRNGTNGSVFTFSKSDVGVGSISVTTTATAYNTSSDYRLKENVAPLSGAIDRLQQIPVHRFNFIADPDTVVDGFIAHEAQEIVPECVTGTKDEVDEDGNPVYQGIDQAKLVPLLTAALQEAITEIESLKGRVAALEAQ